MLTNQSTSDIQTIMILLKCVLILLTVGSTYAQKSREMMFTNLNYTVDTKYWNFTMWVNDSRASMIIVSKLPITGITIDMKLYVNTGGAKGEFVHFFTDHLNFCDFVQNPISNTLGNMLLQSVLKNKKNHIVTKCPIAPVSYHSLIYQMASIRCLCVLLRCRARTGSKISH